VKRSFLACYDYGQGGVWLYIQADSPDEIRRNYPKLTVFEAPPPFWTDELEALAKRHDPAVSQDWAVWLAKLNEPN
jgi:hypothetical protein